MDGIVVQTVVKQLIFCSRSNIFGVEAVEHARRFEHIRNPVVEYHKIRDTKENSMSILDGMEIRQSILNLCEKF